MEILSQTELETIIRTLIPKRELGNPFFHNTPRVLEKGKQKLIKLFFLYHFQNFLRLKHGQCHFDKEEILDRQRMEQNYKLLNKILLNGENEALLDGSVDLGGAYQTPTFGSIKLLAEKIKKHMRVNKDTVLLDIGAGQNRPAIILASMLGCRTIGIEIDKKRVNVAASSAMQILNFEDIQTGGWNTNFALHCMDAVEKADWSSVDIFICWDSAFNSEVTEGIHNNIGTFVCVSKRLFIARTNIAFLI